MIERRLSESSRSWFPPTPALADGVRDRLPARPDEAGGRRVPRRALAVAVAALALAGTAVAASFLDLVPGVRIQRVEQLPEVEYATPVFGQEETLDDVRETLPFELVLPDGLGEPQTVFLDRDRSGAPVVTAVYGDEHGARLVLTQWEASVILFDKLLGHYARSEYVDVGGAPGIWIEGGDHAVFYLGESASEDRVGGYLAGNVLVWQRGQVSYRLELGTAQDEALELAASLRPPR
jgi:hypothetical protein